MDKPDARYANFWDSVSGAKASTCEALGSGYSWREYYFFKWGTATAYTITINSCSGQSFKVATAQATVAKARVSVSRTRDPAGAEPPLPNEMSEARDDDDDDYSDGDDYVPGVSDAPTLALAAAPIKGVPAAVAGDATLPAATPLDSEVAAAAEEDASLQGAGQPLTAGGFAELDASSFSAHEPLGGAIRKRRAHP